MQADKPYQAFLIAALIALLTGCATPASIKTANQAQLKGYQEVKRQINEFYDQLERLLRTYTSLNLEGTQRAAILNEINTLATNATPMDVADQKIVDTRKRVADALQSLFTDLDTNLTTLQANHNAALTEIDNLVAIHSVINDYLGVNLTVSSEDITEIITAFKKLHTP